MREREGCMGEREVTRIGERESTYTLYKRNPHTH